MRLVKPLLILLAVLVLQQLVFSRIALMGIKVDFLLFVVVMWGVKAGSQEGALWGGALGLIQDLFSSTFYVHVISKTIVGYAAGKFQKSFFAGRYVLPMAMVFLVSLLGMLIDFSILYVLGKPMAHSLWFIFMPALFNGLLTPLFYYVSRI